MCVWSITICSTTPRIALFYCSVESLCATISSIAPFLRSTCWTIWHTLDLDVLKHFAMSDCNSCWTIAWWAIEILSATVSLPRLLPFLRMSGECWMMNSLWVIGLEPSSLLRNRWYFFLAMLESSESSLPGCICGPLSTWDALSSIQPRIFEHCSPYRLSRSSDIYILSNEGLGCCSKYDRGIKWISHCGSWLRLLVLG